VLVTVFDLITDPEEGTAMSRILPLIGVLLALTGTTPAIGQDQVYKWIDDIGETHYTQLPPADREYEVMKQAAAPAEDPGKIRANLNEQAKTMDKQQKEKAEAVKDAEQWARIQKLRRENCAIAKQNLANLQQGGQKLIKTGDGQYIRLTDEDRQQRIDTANQQIEENCE
jgi:hypothetical protein